MGRKTHGGEKNLRQNYLDLSNMLLLCGGASLGGALSIIKGDTSKIYTKLKCDAIEFRVQKYL